MSKIKIEALDFLEYRTFDDFNKAVKFCEDEYGYGGEAWELVKQTNNFHDLEAFLIDDGIHAEVKE